jgi:peptidoglycan/xylan/chitin deacetylase (PgdA/CDA1 family)
MLKGKKLVVVFGIIIVALGLFFGFIRGKYVVPILMYHSIQPQPPLENRLAASPQAFERQMDFLKRNHYRVLKLEELANLMRQKKKIPPRAIAITFDDGYKDNYTYTFPILKKYGIPATFFIIVQEVGRADRLSWEEILKMQNSGLATIGSHTVGPEPLTRIKSEEELKRQIFDSKEMLEQKLGRRVDFFSYPEGRFNAKIRQLVIAAGYRAAVATSPGKRYPSDDVFALKRLRISQNASNLLVFWLETSGFYTFIKERHKK